MEKQHVDKLIESLSNHYQIIKPDKDKFSEILLNTSIEKSGKFYEDLPDKNQLLMEGDKYFELSLRKILRNENAENYSPSFLKNMYENLISHFSSYSSDNVSRNLRSNEDIVNLLKSCKYPFSLLGKFETHDHGNSEEVLYSATRPLLIIPGLEDLDLILNWEKDNTIYTKEDGNFSLPKKIKAEEYFSS